MILDVYDSLYVWVGRGANETEKKEALRVAQVTSWSCDMQPISTHPGDVLPPFSGVCEDRSIRSGS